MLTNASLLRTAGNFSDSIEETRLLPHLQRAELDLKRLFADYADVEADLESSPAQRSLDMQRGETYLALSYAITPLNSRASAEGGFVQSIGFNHSETRLLSPRQAEDLSGHYLQQAYNILMPYIDTEEESVSRVFGRVGFIAV